MVNQNARLINRAVTIALIASLLIVGNFCLHAGNAYGSSTPDVGNLESADTEEYAQAIPKSKNGVAPMYASSYLNALGVFDTASGQNIVSSNDINKTGQVQSGQALTILGWGDMDADDLDIYIPVFYVICKGFVYDQNQIVSIRITGLGPNDMSDATAYFEAMKWYTSISEPGNYSVWCLYHDYQYYLSYGWVHDEDFDDVKSAKITVAPVVTAPVPTVPDSPAATAAAPKDCKVKAWHKGVKISGTNKVGKKLTAKYSKAKAVTGIKYSYTYKWYANSKVIKGATKQTYKIAKKYKGKRISVKVTCTASVTDGAQYNLVGSSNKTVTSKKTGKIK
jgi:hypothetical protein